MMTRTLQSRKAQLITERVLTIIVMTSFAVVMVVPFLWMISTSLKSNIEINFNQGFIPQDWAWKNYLDAWKSARFSQSFRNSAIITFFGMLGALFSNSFIAYGFAKFRFKGRSWMFMLVLATMMIPSYSTLVPTYVMFSKLGWIKTFLPLIVPSFFGNAFYIFLFRQFILGIPNDYMEAARLEGAGEVRIYASIVLPLVKPALISVAIFEFNGKWNEFFNAMLYLQNERLYTVQLTLRGMLSAGNNNWPVFMAAATIALLPVLVVFFVLQKYFVEGVSSAGIK